MLKSPTHTWCRGRLQQLNNLGMLTEGARFVHIIPSTALVLTTASVPNSTLLLVNSIIRQWVVARVSSATCSLLDSCYNRKSFSHSASLLAGCGHCCRRLAATLVAANFPWLRFAITIATIRVNHTQPASFLKHGVAPFARRPPPWLRQDHPHHLHLITTTSSIPFWFNSQCAFTLPSAGHALALFLVFWLPSTCLGHWDRYFWCAPISSWRLRYATS